MLDASDERVLSDVSAVERCVFAALTLAECVQVRSHAEQVEGCLLLQGTGICRDNDFEQRLVISYH